MPAETHAGVRHCGAIRFQAEADLGQVKTRMHRFICMQARRAVVVRQGAAVQAAEG